MPRLLTLAFLAVAVLVASTEASATPAAPPAAAQARPEVIPQIRVSLDQAVAIARRAVPGRVVGAESRYRRGRVTHEVKILTDAGALHILRVDGDSGRVAH